MKRKALTILMTLVMVFTFVPLTKMNVFAGNSVSTEMTLGQEGPKSGLLLVGDKEAVYSTDYEYKESDHIFVVKTSGWTLKTSNTEIESDLYSDQLYINIGTDQLDFIVDSISVTIGDIDNSILKNANPEILIKSKNQTDVYIDAERPLNVNDFAALADNKDGEVNIEFLSNSTINTKGFNAGDGDSAYIKGPGKINASYSFALSGREATVDNVHVNCKSEGEAAVAFMTQASFVNGCTLIADCSFFGIIVMQGSDEPVWLSISKDTELFATGGLSALVATVDDGFKNLDNWGCNENVLSYEDKEEADKPVALAGEGMLSSVVKDDPEKVAKSVYSKRIIEHTVKFDLQGHGSAIDDIKVSDGDTIEKPADPKTDDFAFGGWYKEVDCTNKWDFANDTVTADMTLYAKWTAAKDPVDPDDPEDEDDSDVVDTGDHNNVLPYGITMILALAGIGIAAKKRKED